MLNCSFESKIIKIEFAFIPDAKLIYRYVVKTLDNAESVKLQYRSLAKVPDDSSLKPMSSKMAPNWL